jgi:hypothetical protein
MELRISENQLKSLIRNTLQTKEIGEQEEPVNPQPEAGTSDKQTGGSGYPAVGKWESGVTRGPANQVGVTKWSDVVGANLKRGKANQLKEQSSYEKGIWDKSTKTLDNLSDIDLNKIWDNAGPIMLTIGSIAAAIFIPGAQGLWISVGLDLFVAADQYFRKKDSFGASLSVALAFVPFIGRYLPKFTNVSKETAKKLMEKFANANTYQEIKVIMEGLPKQERYLVQELVDLIKGQPKRFQSIIKEVVSSRTSTKTQAVNVAKKINSLLKLGTKRGGLDKVGAEKIVKNLNLRRFGLDFGVSGLIVVGGWKYESWSNENMNRRNIPKDVSYYYQENIKLLEKINQKDFDSKVTPIINQYQELAYTNEMKFLKLYNFVLKTYIKNPNSDFNSLIKKNYNKF